MIKQTIVLKTIKMFTLFFSVWRLLFLSNIDLEHSIVFFRFLFNNLYYFLNHNSYIPCNIQKLDLSSLNKFMRIATRKKANYLSSA